MLLVASPVFAQFGRRKVAPPQGVQPDKQLTQRWQVGAVIQAVGGPCLGLFGTAPVPTEWPEQQVRIVDEDVSQFVDRVNYRDAGAVKQMVFSIRQLPAGETANVLVTFEVTKNSVLAPENPDRFVIPRNAPRDVRIYLGASPQIEVRHSSVRSKVKEIVHDEQTAWKQVEAIYDWVRDNVKYQNGPDKGAVAALRDSNGNKHDLTSLFIALCRANKVPARTVWVPDHCYAEFYLMDQQGQGHWFPCQVAGTRDFGSMPDHRPILQKGENITVPEEREPQRFVPEFLRGRGGQPKVEFVRKLLPAN
jgi:transglutaminase-like putative cysteine protease